MTKEQYNILYEKYLSGNCSSAERELIENYRDTFEFGNQEWDAEQMGNTAEVKQSILDDINYSIRSSDKKVRRIKLIRWYAAASIILIMFSAVYFRTYQTEEKLAASPVSPKFKNDVAPGMNKAVLTLDDGSQINLDDAESGVLASESNTDIKKLAGGQLYYSKATGQAATEIRYNTVTTPRGGQFHITLPDGSEVWLNAGSSIRFPTAFPGSERRVELRGEAYFEVAKNAGKPFLVAAYNSEIKVLGTHFNIMAYDDEKEMNTTLLEGSVEVTRGLESQRITPGHSAIINKGTGKLTVEDADLEQAIAWKNDYFIFDNENIESIMRKVSRWYNVDITYKGNMRDKDFAGTISRKKNISELLRMLELTGAVHFNVEERRITVMP
jgi:transmembrane sensor